jgi:hypothetical protein
LFDGGRLARVVEIGVAHGAAGLREEERQEDGEAEGEREGHDGREFIAGGAGVSTFYVRRRNVSALAPGDGGG